LMNGAVLRTEATCASTSLRFTGNRCTNPVVTARRIGPRIGAWLGEAEEIQFVGAYWAA